MEILCNVIISFISGILGGSIGTVVINKKTIKNKNVTYNNNGDIKYGK